MLLQNTGSPSLNFNHRIAVAKGRTTCVPSLVWKQIRRRLDGIRRGYWLAVSCSGCTNFCEAVQNERIWRDAQPHDRSSFIVASIPSTTRASFILWLTRGPSSVPFLGAKRSNDTNMTTNAYKYDLWPPVHRSAWQGCESGLCGGNVSAEIWRWQSYRDKIPAHTCHFCNLLDLDKWPTMALCISRVAWGCNKATHQPQTLSIPLKNG